MGAVAARAGEQPFCPRPRLGGLSLANAFAYWAFVMETGVEPFDHLAFPIGYVGQLMPGARAVGTIGNANQVASCAVFVYRWDHRTQAELKMG
jgi:hypothetical protein